MTEVLTEPTPAVSIDDAPRCENLFVCEGGCDPAPCGVQPVITRASFTCSDCSVRHVMLLCAGCTELAAKSEHPFELRPL